MMTENIRKTLEFLKSSYENCPYFKDNPADGAYRYEHSLRVAHIGAEIARRAGLDVEALTIACLLHDIAYSRTIPPGGWNEHGRVGAAIARPFLETLQLGAPAKADILYGIAIHVDDNADFDGERSITALSVADADNIDRFGTFRIYDAMRFAGFYEMSLSEKLDWTRHRVSSIERLKDIEFASESAKALWLETIDYQTDFFTRLLRQLERSRIPEDF
ncbi:MAG: HD domain-containing protein [Ruminococcaceae bacterium]|nr:HD domain-containing protein [Oscillospiraceae bacterium]